VRDAVGLAVGNVAVGVAVGSGAWCVMLLAWRPSAILRSAWLLAVVCVVGVPVGGVAVGGGVGCRQRKLAE
jgi:hypothetical protein